MKGKMAIQNQRNKKEQKQERKNKSERKKRRTKKQKRRENLCMLRKHCLKKKKIDIHS